MIPFRRALLAVGLMASLTGLWSAQAAPPEPAVVPIMWELTFKQHAPERLITAPEGKTDKQAYWYMRYTVINNTGQDLLYTPEFLLITDTGQRIIAGKGVDSSIYPQIKTLHNNRFLESPVEVLGKILQGEDNAKDSVAIFTGIDPQARNFKIFVSGLSGETAVVTNPVTKEPVVLHKTLVLDYDIPGEALGIDPKPQFKGSSWVMK